MRVLAVSDLHIDYEVNAKWVRELSAAEYRDDLLIVAGDVSDTRRLLAWCFGELVKRFRKVLFVPGNHELWVLRNGRDGSSLDKFEEVRELAESSGVSTRAFRSDRVAIIPLFSWYDYSFGEPTSQLRSMWADYRACRWPAGFDEKRITAYFASLNNGYIRADGERVITYSHFLPRIDLMPSFIPSPHRVLDPVLGSAHLDKQLRKLDPAIHVYGHSHVNRHVTIEGITYINNAFGYPGETWFTAKCLKCIHEC